MDHECGVDNMTFMPALLQSFDSILNQKKKRNRVYYLKYKPVRLFLT